MNEASFDATNTMPSATSSETRGLVRDRADGTFGRGVVHGDIEASKPRDGLVDHIADVILLADVGVDERGFRAESAQLLDERPAGLITPTGNDDLRAPLGKRRRRRRDLCL